MEWTAAIDLYCERTSAAFWAEPLNAWSNLSFPLAALWAAHAAQRRGGASGEFRVLMALAALVGLGSFLFHTFANTWSEYADTIPIWTFVAAMVFVAIRRILGLRPGPVVLAGLALAAGLVILRLAATDLQPAIPLPPDPLNGSGQYAPALAALAFFAAIAWYRALPSRGLLAAATATFLAALALRSLDLRLCPLLPTGTHFLWHLLLGAMVGQLLLVMLQAERRSPAEER